VSVRQVLSDVEDERLRQNDRWGVVHDDRHTWEDWRSYMTEYLLKADYAQSNSPELRKRLGQVAAIAVAAVESFDRNRGFPALEEV
jgi:hypothetical protein